MYVKARRKKRGNAALTRPFIVAQIFNLPYRGIAFRQPSEYSGGVVFGRAADCKSAIQQIKNLRYVTVLLPRST